MVQEVQHWQEQQERETKPQPADSGKRSTKHVRRSKHHKLNTAARQAHTQQAHSQHSDQRMQTSTDTQTSAGRRRSQRLQRQHEIAQATQNDTNSWDIYSTIFRQQNEEQQIEAVWTTLTPDIALPLAAITTGHLLAHGTDSMATLKQGKRHQDNWKCARCQHTLYHDVDRDEGGKASATWRMIIHTLVHCTQRACKSPQQSITANRPEPHRNVAYSTPKTRYIAARQSNFVRNRNYKPSWTS